MGQAAGVRSSAAYLRARLPGPSHTAARPRGKLAVARHGGGASSTCVQLCTVNTVAVPLQGKCVSSSVAGVE